MAVTRISGIIYGVLLTMIMSVLVFPKSASHQATDNLKAGLIKLAELNIVAWRKEAGCTARSDIMHPAKVTEPDYDSMTCNGFHQDVETGDKETASWDEEGADKCCDKVQTLL